MVFMRKSSIGTPPALWRRGRFRVMQGGQVAPVAHNVENRHRLWRNEE